VFVAYHKYRIVSDVQYNYLLAPAMLLEHCDQPLQDWLKSIKHVTPDVLDNMLKYSLDIARGMDHLTNNGVSN